MDYAMKKGVSLSTLRRYIKANKIRFKTEHGRYLIWDEDGVSDGAGATAAGDVRWAGRSASEANAQESGAQAKKIEELEKKLLRAQEEISELKMLVALYEEQLFQNKPSLRI